MEHKLNNTVRKATLTLFSALIALTAGCGDGFLNRGEGVVHSALSRHIRGAVGGSEIDVLEYTACEAVESDGSQARCAGVSGTQVEVFVDGESIIFDFSNVSKDGKISDADFEGYILTVTENSGLPPILEAIVDAAKSTVDSGDFDVQFDHESVAVNFQGLDYDDATFIKVDLVFDEAS